MSTNTKPWLFKLALVVVSILALLPVRQAHAATFTVTSTNDVDDGTCNATHCSLREAINAANASMFADTIAFDVVPCELSTGRCTIHPTRELPALSGGQTIIDGYTQGSATPATASAPARILIQIDGSEAGSANGLLVNSANNTVRGLAIYDFAGNGIVVSGAGAQGNTISGNHVGLNAAGDADLGNAGQGVLVTWGAHNNTVGGDEPAERNVIFGNTQAGVALYGATTTGNVVAGNHIGLNQDGVRVYGGAYDNTLGGESGVARNVISGNRRYGVSICDAATDGNTVLGNHIGVDAAGSAALPNSSAGVYLCNGAQENTIGPGNLIAGNAGDGVEITGAGTDENTVSGNLIGTNALSAPGLGNYSGVYVHGGAQYSAIGGEDENDRNVISGNMRDGIEISGAGTRYTQVVGNYVGTDASGAVARGNGRYGVSVLRGVQVAWIVENVIAGNAADGVWLEGAEGAEVSGVQITANLIGLAADGAMAMGNAADGVHVSADAHDNSVQANRIWRNRGDGVGVDTPTAFGNFVVGNSIWANDGLGIRLTNGANDEIDPPTILGIDMDAPSVRGTACGGCTVLVFASRDADGEGERYLGGGAADPAGDFSVDVAVPPYPYLTATATDDDGNTSQFSAVFTGTYLVYLPLVTSE